ncbi:MAG: translation initiation factor [Candidatus Marinimicrobia bacterium]|nr:translation initiation factor [Candidatus Neomarinimicrobiota bacterium]MBL7010470.1 translation initiation factor [Candidatus Neomarinimicrobiota bacterium]MBL7030971.1 translation initiation factor [Candidatus Neomarinimicrobiota bacterium]
MNKNRPNIVYSTDPHYAPEQEVELTTSRVQDFRVHLDRRGAGKIVTIVRGFTGNKKDLNELGRELRKKCGVGGSVKENEILVQGNVRDKVLNILIKKGYAAKASGG